MNHCRSFRRWSGIHLSNACRRDGRNRWTRCWHILVSPHIRELCSPSKARPKNSWFRVSSTTLACVSPRTWCASSASAAPIGSLPLVAALAIAPLLGERRHDGYDMVRPPTRLLLVVDPDAHWSTDAKVETQRRKIMTEIQKVVAVQGDPLSVDDLDSLVVVRRWPASCFEFAHFSDEEIATAITTIHPTCGGLSLPDLIARVAETRMQGADVKRVWDNKWQPKPTKLDLANTLWPTLRQKIDDAASSDAAPMPPVADVVREAYALAQKATYGTYVIRVADTTAPD